MKCTRKSRALRVHETQQQKAEIQNNSNNLNGWQEANQMNGLCDRLVCVWWLGNKCASVCQIRWRWQFRTRQKTTRQRKVTSYHKRKLISQLSQAYENSLQSNQKMFGAYDKQTKTKQQKTITDKEQTTTTLLHFGICEIFDFVGRHLHFSRCTVKMGKIR